MGYLLADVSLVPNMAKMEEFAAALIRNAGVVTVPGSAFGKMGQGHLRLVFANSDENLREAVKRIGEYVQKAYPDLQ